MIKTPIWIDTDTGVDDAIALLIALKLDKLDIKGVSAVAGNATIDNTFKNCRNVLSLGGREDIKVYKGASKPLFVPLKTAPHAHGEDGLGGAFIENSKAEVEKEYAIDALYQRAIKENGELKIVAVGPLTNIALAFKKYPELKALIKEILIMGGAAKGGNVTSSAEFNIYADPHAAEAVFRSEVPIKMFGLDVTLNAYITMDEYNEIANNGSKVSKLFKESTGLMLSIYERLVGPELCIHDACPLIYLEYPDLFKGELCGVHIETKGKYTFGETVCDLWADRKYGIKNAEVMLEVNRDALAKHVVEIMKSY